MHPAIGRRLAAEALGTFVFVFVGAGSAIGARQAGVSDPGVALVIAAFGNGLGLAVAVTATMKVSGGSLNPAITLALFAAGKLPGRDVIPYILVELLAAVAGALALVAAIPQSLGAAVNWGSPVLASNLGTGQGIVLELLATVFLAVAVFWTAVSPDAPSVAGFGIGMAVVADIFMMGPLTGAAMNPARAVGPMVAGLWFPGYWYIYWVGPILGALMVGMLYRMYLGEGSDRERR